MPKEILSNQHTILVWDNNDFGEEAKVFTHITNGIAIQREKEDDVILNLNVPKSQSKSLCTLPCEILSYVVGKKQSPDLHSLDLSKQSLDLSLIRPRRKSLHHCSRVCRKM